MSLNKSILALAIIATLSSTAAFAGARVNEVNARTATQQQRIDNGVASGKINAKQEARDEKRLTRVETQESKAEAKNDGHLTKGQTAHFNKELNKNSKDIKKQ